MSFKTDEDAKAYWSENLRLLIALLCVWFFVSFGCGILFADTLNEMRLGGFPVGFWFAQQGSIVTFVILILVYAVGMGRLDRQHHAELEILRTDTRIEATDPR